MKNLMILSIVLSALLFSSCSKDEEEEYQATKMQLIEKLDKLDVPEVMKSSDNSNAVEAVGYVDEVKGIADYFNYIDVPDGANHKKVDGNDEFTYNYGGYSLIETHSETSDAYVWALDVDLSTGVAKYIVAEEKKDGSGGSMDIYDGIIGGEGKVIFTYDWSFDKDGNATLVWASADNSFSQEIISNVDLSGSATVYAGGVKFQEFKWNSDGSGSAAYFMGGIPITEETWTAADL